MSRAERGARLLAAAAVVALVATGCGGQGRAGEATGERALEVVTSFYPLEHLVGQVAGDRVEVSTLTGPGVDPHSLELTPQAVARVGRADLVVYSSGLQAAVDRAVETQAPQSAFDVVPAADVRPTGSSSHPDPHWWLDPARYADVTAAVAAELTRLDPDGEEAYAQGAKAFTDELAALDAELDQGLAGCRQQVVVTSHEAFGYLTDRYGLDQVGIAGLSPEAEPSPARLAQITATVRETGVGTVYAEVVLGSGLAEAVARETGAQVLVLDPVEGLTGASAGTDYLSVMRANLAALREGQDCP